MRKVLYTIRKKFIQLKYIYKLLISNTEFTLYSIKLNAGGFRIRRNRKKSLSA